jgi:hypothetical protein
MVLERGTNGYRAEVPLSLIKIQLQACRFYQKISHSTVNTI